MISSKLQLALIGVLVVGLTVGLAFVVLEPRFQAQEKDAIEQTVASLPETTPLQGQGRDIPSDVIIDQEFSYESLTREEMIDQAGIIFVGKVTAISSSRWNQDSGEPWYDETTGYGLQFHTIEFEILQPIVDTIGVEKQVTITVLGASPVDNQADQGDEQVITQGGPDHHLKVGDEAVIFAVQTDLTWREGTQPIVELVGVPDEAHFIREEDGLYHGRYDGEHFSLEELIQRITQRREVVQP